MFVIRNDEKKGDNEQNEKTPVVVTSFKSGEEKAGPMDNPMYATIGNPLNTMPPEENGDEKEDLGTSNPGYKNFDDDSLDL